MPRILLTTTSYQDTPGDHHALLESQGFDIQRERGPLDEAAMLDLAGDFDGLLCGDDALTRQVLERHAPRLKVISKYGIGLDKIDLEACAGLGLPVLYTPGVNHTTVAEHTFCLLLALVRNLVAEANHTRAGEWVRLTGHEIWGKRIGLIGLGRIGQEVAKRAAAFGMEIHGFGNHWPDEVAAGYQITRHRSLDDLFANVEIVSPHTKLTAATHGLINAARLSLMPEGSYVVNTGRGEMADLQAVIAALDSGKLAGYATDVLDQEPPPPDHPLLAHPRALVTPHIGSRTYESVPRQALKATHNLINFLKGSGEIFQANQQIPVPEGLTVSG
ncbi:D-glycerate dehydrogenase [soil metagenome]